MQIVVSGATGLIGGALSRLLRQTNDVVHLGRRPPAQQIADFAAIDSIEAIDLQRCDAVVHCAGIVEEDFAEDPERAFRQATLGMAALVRRAKACRARRFVYLSTAHIYGPLKGRIDEGCPANPFSDYAIAHYASEQILRRAISSEFVAAVVRPNAVFGIPPDLARFRRWTLIPFAFPRDAIRKGAIELKTPGLQRRNFVGTRDIASAVSQWLNVRDPEPFTAINPIGQFSSTVWEFAHLCASIAESVTKRPCKVCRPDPSGMTEELFEYSTLDARYLGTEDIREAMLELITILNGAE